MCAWFLELKVTGCVLSHAMLLAEGVEVIGEKSTKVQLQMYF
jgi:hypothetical protein